jgi:hypothetical protein
LDWQTPGLEKHEINCDGRVSTAGITASARCGECFLRPAPD